MAARKTDPVKHCEADGCGKQLTRRTEGRREGHAEFLKRRFCCVECANKRPPVVDAAVLPADVGEEWMQDALCAEIDPEIFFPPEGVHAEDARRVCVRCDVREECLAYALRDDSIVGIWGGLSERERRAVRRQRRLAAASHQETAA